MGQTVIEINGVLYDATTGAVVSRAVPQQPVATPTRTVGHNIDGIVSANKPTVILQPPTTKKFQPTIGHQVHDITMVHHKHASKSRTLMRSAVKKPGVTPQTNPLASTISPVHHSPSYASASSEQARLGKALHTPTHGSVSKFHTTSTTKLEPQLTHMPVMTPVEPTPPPITPNYRTSTPKHGASNFIAAQLAKEPNTEQSSPFKKQPLRKRVGKKLKSTKLKSIAAASLTTLLIGGFIAYQNMPSIALALANRNSGISAKMPKGVPSNFAINRTIDASKGQVTLLFTSRSDGRQFSLTQQTSDMSSAELEQALAASNSKAYQSYESNGIKLFITGPGSADWIDGNMRYNVTGSSGLSSEQLATIARSL